MKTRLLIVLSSLLITGIASAQTQDQSMQPATTSAQGTVTTSPTQSNPAASNGTDSATYNTAQGEVTVVSTMGSAPPIGSPPSFEQLAHGKAYISKQDAKAFPPLANDFGYAAREGGRINKAQYEKWLKSLD